MIDNEFIASIVENLIANVPQFVALVTIVLYNLNKIKSKTGEFSSNVADAKNVLKESFDKTVGTLVDDFQQATQFITTQFDTMQKEMFSSFNDLKDKLVLDVTDKMSLMQKELSTYQDDLRKNTEQVNLEVLQSKKYMEILTLLVSQDPNKVKSGIATLLTNKVLELNEILEKEPEKLLGDNAKKVEDTLKNVIEIVGRKNFDEILRKMSYERKKEKL